MVSVGVNVTASTLVIARAQDGAGGGGVGERAGDVYGLAADSPGGGAAELAVGQGGAVGEAHRCDADLRSGLRDADAHRCGGRGVVGGIGGGEGDGLALAVAGAEDGPRGAGVSEASRYGDGIPADGPRGGAAELAIDQRGAVGDIHGIDAHRRCGLGDVDGRGRGGRGVVGAVARREGDRFDLAATRGQDFAGIGGVGEDAGDAHRLPAADPGGGAAELAVGQGGAVGEAHRVHVRHRRCGLGDVDGRGRGGRGVVGGVGGGERDRLDLVIARAQDGAGGGGVGERAGDVYGLAADSPGGGAAELAVGQGGAVGEAHRVRR